MNLKLISEFYNNLVIQQEQSIKDNVCGIYVLYIKNNQNNSNIIPIILVNLKI